MNTEIASIEHNLSSQREFFLSFQMTRFKFTTRQLTTAVASFHLSMLDQRYSWYGTGGSGSSGISDLTTFEELHRDADNFSRICWWRRVLNSQCFSTGRIRPADVDRHRTGLTHWMQRPLRVRVLTTNIASPGINQNPRCQNIQRLRSKSFQTYCNLSN